MAGSKEYDRALVLLAASRHDEAMQLLSAIGSIDFC